MSIPKISVVVPCYNQAEFMDECLQSVLDQTYQDWECIIVNDGSPDNTENVALEWTAKDNRFRYLKKENGGLSSARNAGIESAKGEWILPLDCDDKIGNQYLQLASAEFKKNYTIIYCEAEYFGIKKEQWNLPVYNYDYILNGNIIFCSAFFKKTDWTNTDGFDENLVYGKEDWDFWLSILDENKQICKLDYIGFFYRRKEESMDVEINKSKFKNDFSLNYIYKKHLNKYLPDNMTGIENYVQQKRRSENLQFYNEKVNKNFITKFLFSLITKL